MSQLGTFVEDLGAGMPKDSPKHILEISGCHIHNWNLRRTQTPVGERYILEESNPNKTLIYSSYIVDDLTKFKGLNLESWHGKDVIDLGYEELKAGLFIVAPDNLYQCQSKKDVRALFDNNKTPRKTKLWLSTEEESNPAIRRHWHFSNLPIEDIQDLQLRYLNTRPNSAEVAVYLQAMTPDAKDVFARSGSLYLGHLDPLQIDNLVMFLLPEHKI
ncbi:MAG: hypothetical protein V4568_12775 [Pseudomonadota bacterium]